MCIRDRGYIAGIRGKALGGGFLEGVKTIAPCLPMIWAILSITYVLQAVSYTHLDVYKRQERRYVEGRKALVFALGDERGVDRSERRLAGEPRTDERSEKVCLLYTSRCV